MLWYFVLWQAFPFTVVEYILAKAFLLSPNQQQDYEMLTSVCADWHNAVTGRQWVEKAVRLNLKHFRKISLCNVYALYFCMIFIVCYKFQNINFDPNQKSLSCLDKRIRWISVNIAWHCSSMYYRITICKKNSFSIIVNLNFNWY